MGFEFLFIHTTEFTLQAAWRFSRYSFLLLCLSTILMATEFTLLQFQMKFPHRLQTRTTKPVTGRFRGCSPQGTEVDFICHLQTQIPPASEVLYYLNGKGQATKRNIYEVWKQNHVRFLSPIHLASKHSPASCFLCQDLKPQGSYTKNLFFLTASSLADQAERSV